MQESVREIHKSGELHNLIVAEPGTLSTLISIMRFIRSASQICLSSGKYIVSNPKIKKLLIRLKKHRKKVFLLTNSPFDFV